MSTLNEHLPQTAGRPAGAPCAELTPQPPLLADRFLYMMEGPEAKVAALDARMVRLCAWHGDGVFVCRLRGKRAGEGPAQTLMATSHSNACSTSAA